MKLTKNIEGCSGKEIHPRTYKKGDECPADLLEAAIALDALSEKDAAAAKKAIADAKEAAQAPEETASEGQA